MKYLVWLGMEEKGTYDIIKKIAKKKFPQEELDKLHKQLENGWINKIGTVDGFAETWQVVQDAARYSFNASHSLSVAIDSIYGAYLKSHYPLEYFTVVLTLYADDIDRTSKLISELPCFGISLKPIKFGKSLADYTMDKEGNCIYKGIESIKFCNAQIADELIELSKNHYNTFIDLLADIDKNTSLNSRQLEILIKLNFFEEFGGNKMLLSMVDIYNKLYSAKVISKSKMEQLGLSEYLMAKYAGKETKSQYREIDNKGLIKEMCSRLKDESLNIIEQMKAELEFLGYVNYKNEDMAYDYYAIVSFETYRETRKPNVVLRRICDGEELKARVKQVKVFEEHPFGLLSIIKLDTLTYEFKSKMINGEWQKTDETELILREYEVIKG